MFQSITHNMPPTTLATPPSPKSPKRKRSDQTNTEEEEKKEEEEPISDDHLCPICHLLLASPVTTRCKHTLCSTCHAHWASVSLSSQMTIVRLSSTSPPPPPPPTTTTTSPSSSAAAIAAVEAKCPMCRTPTTAVPDAALAAELASRYPAAYAARLADEERDREAERRGPGTGVRTMVVEVGNTHRRVVGREGGGNTHDWTFFVRPEVTEWVEEVQIFLHPTFRPPRIIKHSPPYEIRRLGWGYFTITAHIILKAGYSWLSDDAEDAPDGARKGMLPIHWTLDFDGAGSQGRRVLKVKCEVEEEAEGDEGEWEDVDERVVPPVFGSEDGESGSDEDWEDAEHEGPLVAPGV